MLIVRCWLLYLRTWLALGKQRVAGRDYCVGGIGVVGGGGGCGVMGEEVGQGVNEFCVKVLKFEIMNSWY